MAEINQQEILKQAKKIIDSFHNSLKDVEKLEEVRVEREECERVEREGEEGDAGFREIMLKNAPEREGDCIKAERGKWV
ncbi:MAG: hypothetical protein KKB21_04275 [Nanoarchaeota archaeon]|nr:hypothetical protein [Nanoarchaeota archaeon]MBU4086763.1 hypothetical protein [Nanoarchaeota archaeon]